MLGGLVGVLVGAGLGFRDYDIYDIEAFAVPGGELEGGGHGLCLSRVPVEDGCCTLGGDGGIDGVFQA